MALKHLSVVIGLLNVVTSLPAVTLQDLEMVDDTMSVGSYLRPVRAASPDDFHKSYEKEGDGEIGYSRKKSGGGKKGYQHFETFHKKAGDNFEFEKQDAYGLEDGEQNGAHTHRHERREKPAKDFYEYGYGGFPAEESAPSRSSYKEELRERPADAEEIDKKKQRNNREHLEDIEHEELREGASDGNGDIEAFGHNENDYKLPEKYTYGEGEEYNF